MGFGLVRNNCKFEKIFYHECARTCGYLDFLLIGDDLELSVVSWSMVIDLLILHVFDVFLLGNVKRTEVMETLM